MPKNVVVCLDGTNNKVRAAANTNVVRLYRLLDLDAPTRQVGYYAPGVGTFSHPAAWSRPARAISRWSGLAFGSGLRHNLGGAYTYLMSVYEPGDRIFVFGFSRGAYTARALTGMLEVFGIFRRGAENLVPFAVSEYARQVPEGKSRDWKVLREYARIFGGRLGVDRRDHAPVDFVGLWDTVKAAGTLRRELRWPFTRQMPHAAVIRHAVAIDEWRGKYAEYLVAPPDPDHLIPSPQDLLQVWFAGVHSDVGGMFAEGARLSDIPLKWMADEAITHGLLVPKPRYAAVAKVTEAEATGSPHTMSAWWRVLGSHQRMPPAGSLLHDSVRVRIANDASYAARIPLTHTFVDAGWMTPRL